MRIDVLADCYKYETEINGNRSEKILESPSWFQDHSSKKLGDQKNTGNIV